MKSRALALESNIFVIVVWFERMKTQPYKTRCPKSGYLFVQ